MNNFVGIDIGGTKMLLLAQFQGQYIESKIVTGNKVKKEELKQEIDKFISNLPFKPEGIGIAIPGLVKGDKVLFSNVVPALDGVTVEYFRGDKCPAYFINDIKAALVEESQYYPDDYTIALFMVGTGIAAAIKTNGKIIFGAQGISGELGFAPIAVNNEVYTVDSLASGAAILKKAGMPVEPLLAKLNQNDITAAQIVEEAGFYFGIALAIVINIINPNVIIIGGSTATYPGYLNKAIATTKQYALKESVESCSIVSPKDADRVVALGASRFAAQNNR